MSEPDIHQLLELDGGCPMGWYAKGHHDRQAFATQIERDYSYDGPIRVPPNSVRHTWWRCVPTVDEWGYNATRFDVARPHARGAFRVTVTEHHPAAGWAGGSPRAGRCRCSLCRVQDTYREWNKLQDRKRRLQQWRTARDWDQGVVLHNGNPDDAWPCRYVEWSGLGADHVRRFAEHYGFALPAVTPRELADVG